MINFSKKGPSKLHDLNDLGERLLHGGTLGVGPLEHNNYVQAPGRIVQVTNRDVRLRLLIQSRWYRL